MKNYFSTRSIKPFRFILLVTCFFVVITNNSKAQNFKAVPTELSKSDKSNSLLFQSLKGGNRLEVFKKLQTLIKTADVTENVVRESNFMGNNTTTTDELLNLLGNPDNKIAETIFEYKLKPTPSTCKLVVGINKNGLIQFFTIKN